MLERKLHNAAMERSAKLVELCVVFNFVLLALSLLVIPSVQATRSSLLALGFHCVMSIFIALFYGVFISRYETPISKHLNHAFQPAQQAQEPAA